MLWVIVASVFILSIGKLFERVFVKLTGQLDTRYVLFESVIDQFHFCIKL